jgi:hypothetical protein
MNGRRLPALSRSAPTLQCREDEVATRRSLPKASRQCHASLVPNRVAVTVANIQAARLTSGLQDRLSRHAAGRCRWC